MQTYRAMVAGKIEPKFFRAETISDAQVEMLRYYGNTPDVCAMTEVYALNYVKNSYFAKTNARIEKNGSSICTID